MRVHFTGFQREKKSSPPEEEKKEETSFAGIAVNFDPAMMTSRTPSDFPLFFSPHLVFFMPVVGIPSVTYLSNSKLFGYW